MKTRQKACDTPPLRYYLERVLRDMGGYLAGQLAKESSPSSLGLSCVWVLKPRQALPDPHPDPAPRLF